MRPLADMPEAAAAQVRLVLTDIDDTLTSDGRLQADAYRALEDLATAGFIVAPITGRPAGWCDLIARLWPVAGVVGENGQDGAIDARPLNGRSVRPAANEPLTGRAAPQPPRCPNSLQIVPATGSRRRGRAGGRNNTSVMLAEQRVS